MADLTFALTIAGSDSGGGAGVQADLKTFMEHGVYGTSAITAITAQNTRGVQRIDSVHPDGLRAQLRSVLSDFPIGAVKIGMLGTADHARVVLEELRQCADRPPIVLDPVMIATTGAHLVEPDAIEVIASALAPLATVITPNAPEAALLCRGYDLELWASEAANAVLVTGGDLEGPTVINRLFMGREERVWESQRFTGRGFHGTGCTLSSAIAARLALGHPLEEAIDGALSYVHALVKRSAEADFGADVRVLPHGLHRA